MPTESPAVSKYGVLALWLLLVAIFGVGFLNTRGIVGFLFLFGLLFVVTFPFLTIVVPGRLWLGAVLLAAMFNSTVAVGEIFWRHREWVGTWIFFRVQAVCMGAIFAFYITLLLGSRGQWWKDISRSSHRNLVFAMGMFALLALLGVAVGLTYGNDPTYLVGDTFRLVALPLAFLCGYVGTRSMDAPDLLRKISLVILAYLVVHIMITAYYFFETGYLAAGVGGYLMMVPLTFFLPVLFLTRNTWQTLGYLVVTLSVIIASLKRALWVEAVGCIGLAVVLNRRKVSPQLLGRMAVVGLVFIGLLFLAGNGLVASILHAVEGRVRYTLSGWEYDASRIREAKAAIQELHDSSPAIGHLLGMGSGAQFTMRGGVGVDPETLSLIPELHTIHFTPAAVYFRHGALGLVLFSVALLLIVRTLWLENFRPRPDCPSRIVAQCVLLYAVAVLLNSIAAFSIVGDVNLGLLLGILAGERRGRMPAGADGTI